MSLPHRRVASRLATFGVAATEQPMNGYCNELREKMIRETEAFLARWLRRRADTGRQAHTACSNAASSGDTTVILRIQPEVQSPAESSGFHA
jgi:hypothetical protein